MDRDRHLVLSSNGSSDVFPGNTPSDFTTLLAQPLVLERDEYDLALAEFQFVRALPAVTKATFVVKKQAGDTNVKIEGRDISTIQGVVKAINAALSKRKLATIKFTFNTETFKTHIKLPAGVTLELSEELAAVLGFTDKNVAATSEGQTVADLHHGAYHLYIYCDISEPISVGSKMESLLGIVSIPKGARSEPEVVTKTFTNPMFVKIINSRVETVRIYITDDHKNRVHFKIGPAIARIIVRRRQKDEQR